MKVSGRNLGILAASLVLFFAGRWLVVEKIKYRDRLQVWDRDPIELPYYSTAQNSQPDRDFPWEALLAAIALTGAGVGWILNNFGVIDARLDDIALSIKDLQSQSKLSKQERDASLLLLQRDLQLLENSLRELRIESDRHDRRLYKAVENLTEALNAHGLFAPRSQTPDQKGWSTDDPPTGTFGYYRPPTPPPGDAEP